MDTTEYWINGRTLAAALKATGANSRFGRFGPDDRIPLDLKQDSYVLGIELIHGFPFVAEGDLLVTIHDFDLTGPDARFIAADQVEVLANLRSSRSALERGISGYVDAAGSHRALHSKS